MGMCSHAQLAVAYASSDLFLLPSLTETFGNVTLEALAGQQLASLSPSEQQLARIARSLAQPAPLLLLDQWTTNLCAQQQLLLMQRLARLAPTGRTIVCTLPEHSPAASHAQWLVLLAGGVRRGADVVRALALGAPPFTRNMLDSG